MPRRRVARRAARRTVRRSGRRNRTRQSGRRRNRVRRAGVGLLGAAAVGGAGYYTGKKISEGRQAEAMQNQQIADLQDEVAYQQEAVYTPMPSPAPVPASTAPGAGSATVAQLQQLAQLHASGALTDEEFSAAKQKALADE